MADGRDEIRQKDRTSNKYAAKKAATERLAAQRAAQNRAERRRNLLVVGGATLAIVIVIAVIVVIGVTHKSASSRTSAGANPVVAASSTVADAISNVPATTTGLDFKKLVAGPPVPLTGSPLNDSDGKPEVLYIGAEYCPYCAATRWPLAVALARFGTFSDLKTTYSADSDKAGPHTPTLSFYKSTYTSDYIDFVGVEHEDGAGKPLEPLTDAQQTIFQKLTNNSYPAIDFGGKWAQEGSIFSPLLLKGMTTDQVAKQIGDTSTQAGATIQASADMFTAAICDIDGGQPANVCTAPGVTAAKAALSASGK